MGRSEANEDMSKENSGWTGPWEVSCSAQSASGQRNRRGMRTVYKSGCHEIKGSFYFKT